MTFWDLGSVFRSWLAGPECLAAQNEQAYKLPGLYSLQGFMEFHPMSAQIICRQRLRGFPPLIFGALFLRNFLFCCTMPHAVQLTHFPVRPHLISQLSKIAGSAGVCLPMTWSPCSLEEVFWLCRAYLICFLSLRGQSPILPFFQRHISFTFLLVHGG